MWEEKTVKRETIFKGRIVQLNVDTVLLPDGRESTREIVKHKEAVAVVALDEKGNIYMVRQYRKPVEKVLLEIPAGILNDEDEEPLEAAKRELREETGLIAASWEKLASFYTAPGFTDEKIHLFLATRLSQGTQRLDEDEFVEVEVISLARAYEMVLKGEIKDAKSIIGIQWARLQIG
ncbi:ADP-ribose pyrophosphatase [Thermosyntropha lipolytica DSM 11003]|uniref:ADP-ribose pyrophosphatase n=1 Tax=Thermosyntropha lipolytica DSM 11003 TaxID=1123382 RepID=A0A1M5J7V3_9FIRM|nr:NUDIX hydrolase [Thermosyntropha lipolytica]SHG36622.1 ADP-ribose pyrophosphatase [Thermosyntropha lipolytica DSM 11003]